MRQIVFLATNEEMLVDESRFDFDLGESPPGQMTHPDAPSEKFCYWCQDIDNEQGEYWFYLPAEKLRRVRSVSAPRGHRFQVVFLATEERMLVEENSAVQGKMHTPPDLLHHPDKPTEEFRFWRRDRNNDKFEFWFYLPASQFDSLNKILA